MSGDRWSIDLARARIAFTLEAAGIERDARLSDLTAAEIDGILGAVVLAGAASPRLTADAAGARRIADAIQHEAQEEGADSPVDRGDAEKLADAAILALRQGRDPMIETDFQQRVRPWLHACFGDMIAGDREERNHRFLEEALELVQACGCTASEAHQLVDYVFGRPIGEPRQEVGGVMVTLAALCLAHDLDMHADGETELVRIWGKVEAIRAKQAAKPKHSPLPQAVVPRSPAPIETSWHTDMDAAKHGGHVVLNSDSPLWRYPFVGFWNFRDGWWEFSDPNLAGCFAVSELVNQWAPLPAAAVEVAP